MTRITPTKTPEGKSVELLGAVKQQLGSTPNMFTTIAKSPASLEGYLNLSAALSGGRLPAQLREQIALTVAGANGCDYCASAHTFLGERLGVDESEENLRGKSSDPKIAAALQFAKAVVVNRGRVSDAEFGEVRAAGFSEEEVIEIVSHVALNTLTNYMNEVIKTEVDFPTLVSTTSTRLAA